jgi:MFS family permease
MTKKSEQRKTWKNYFNVRKINFVIRMLTFSDIVILSSFGLITPIFAVFITDTIVGGSVEVAGIAAGIYLISKSIFQIPFAAMIDRIKGERDDFWSLFIGSVLFSVIPLLYIVVSTPTQLYLVQFFYGIAAALAVPAWYAIFTRHIDKNYEGIEWGIYQTTVDMGGAATAFLGGLLAYRYGFTALFVVVSIVSLIGSLFLLSIKSVLKKGRVLF